MKGYLIDAKTREIKPIEQPMMSNGILTGCDGNETTLDPALTPQELDSEIEWMSVEDALAWFRKRASDPSVIMTTSDGTSILVHWQDLLDNLEGKRGHQP